MCSKVGKHDLRNHVNEKTFIKTKYSKMRTTPLNQGTGFIF